MVELGEDLFLNTGYRKIIRNNIMALCREHMRRCGNISAEQEKGDAIFVPITKKGYWLFRTSITDSDREEEPMVRYLVYSDRYITKVLDPSEFENKYVLLWDDVYRSGNRLFYFFALLTKWKAKVVPSAYAMLYEPECDEEFDIERKKEMYAEIYDVEGEFAEQDLQHFNGLIAQFKESMICAKRVTREERARFITSEIKWMEQELKPMVIDLPIIREMRGEYTADICISEKAFEKLISSDSNDSWRYIENISNEAPEVSVNASYFLLPELLYSRIKRNIFENFVIKCKYSKAENGIKLVFVPYTIMKSITYNDLVEYFIVFFKDTDYFGDVINALHLEDCNDEEVMKREFVKSLYNNINLYRALYRANVYYYSAYIGREFIVYLHNLLGNELEEVSYDWKFMEDHAPKGLIESLKTEYDKPIEQVKEKIDKLKECRDYPWLNLSKEDFASKRCISQESINISLKELIDEMISKKLYREAMSIEEVYGRIAGKIDITSVVEYKIYITNAILMAQEGSCFGNYLENNKKLGFVIRGFKHGENGSIFLGEDVKYVFPYIYASYLKMNENISENDYEQIAEQIEGLFNRRNYFDYKISRKRFYFYINHFRKFLREIQDNAYMLGGYMEGRNTKYDEIFQLVNNWDIEGV